MIIYRFIYMHIEHNYCLIVVAHFLQVRTVFASLYFSDFLCKVLTKGSEIHAKIWKYPLLSLTLFSIRKANISGFISRFTFILILGRKIVLVESKAPPFVPRPFKKSFHLFVITKIALEHNDTYKSITLRFEFAPLFTAGSCPVDGVISEWAWEKWS